MKCRKSSMSLKGIHPKDNTGKGGHGKVSVVRDEAYFFLRKLTKIYAHYAAVA